MTLLLPICWPKLLSMPQTATNMLGSTWYCASIAFSVLACSASKALPLATRQEDTALSRYSHTGRLNSGWLWSAAITCGSGVKPAKACSNNSGVMPWLRASMRKPARQSVKLCCGAKNELFGVDERVALGVTNGATVLADTWLANKPNKVNIKKDDKRSNIGVLNIQLGSTLTC